MDDSESDDRAAATRALRIQSDAKDIALVSLPRYQKWSKSKLEEGESPAFIAHLDAMSMYLLPEEIAEVDDDIFEELLRELKDECRGDQS